MTSPNKHRKGWEPSAILNKLIVPLRKEAKLFGYALAIHGSLKRDIDIVAVPWTRDAESQIFLANTLIKEIKRVHGTAIVINDYEADPSDWLRHNPQPKPHGRLGWAIQVGHGTYVDLSIFPPRS